ncbi:hypothetical protein Lalb_Chr11g0062961 [Lupinus albus]|uniref:Uncharacterized protein n=1 Tax=Lupinus albus TaxID=3870 RepID=A0A6A4PQV1_LUPAL|nr:hypothetical protein Lalb_Chr11g0062961 [Lupinus albus]
MRPSYPCGVNSPNLWGLCCVGPINSPSANPSVPGHDYSHMSMPLFAKLTLLLVCRAQLLPRAHILPCL